LRVLEKHNVRYLKMTNTPQPDFKVASNGGVTALYVVNPGILALDNPNYIGKPFLFLANRIDAELPAPEVEDGVGGIKPYAGRQTDLEALLQGRTTQGTLPEFVTINDEQVAMEKLLGGIWLSRLYNAGLRGLYVPFSFGLFHQEDVKDWKAQGPSVRTDLDQFKLVLAQYDAQKQRPAPVQHLGLLKRILRPFVGPAMER